MGSTVTVTCATRWLPDPSFLRHVNGKKTKAVLSSPNSSFEMLVFVDSAIFGSESRFKLQIWRNATRNDRP